jgi:hypothetical protein
MCSTKKAIAGLHSLVYALDLKTIVSSSNQACAVCDTSLHGVSIPNSPRNVSSCTILYPMQELNETEKDVAEFANQQVRGTS